VAPPLASRCGAAASHYEDGQIPDVSLSTDVFFLRLSGTYDGSLVERYCGRSDRKSSNRCNLVEALPLGREETITMSFIADSTETGFDARLHWIFRLPNLGSAFRKEKTAEPAVEARASRRHRAKTLLPPGQRFDNTRWSLVLEAGGPSTPASRVALEELCRIYRPALSAFAKHLEFDADRAEDLVQEFFTYLIDPHYQVLAKVDPKRGRFRSFLSKAMRFYAINRYHAEHTLARGGGVVFVEPDDEQLEARTLSADRLFDRYWAHCLIDRARGRLKEECIRAGKDRMFEALNERLVGEADEGTLDELAGNLATTGATLKVWLFRLRAHCYNLIVAEVAETVADAVDIEAEVRHLIEALRGDP
jgi:RNA polymerase sigma-70 factor (ECF subfamily)